MKVLEAAVAALADAATADCWPKATDKTASEQRAVCRVQRQPSQLGGVVNGEIMLFNLKSDFL